MSDMPRAAQAWAQMKPIAFNASNRRIGESANRRIGESANRRIGDDG